VEEEEEIVDEDAEEVVDEDGETEPPAKPVVPIDEQETEDATPSEPDVAEKVSINQMATMLIYLFYPILHFKDVPCNCNCCFLRFVCCLVSTVCSQFLVVSCSQLFSLKLYMVYSMV